MPAVVYQFGKKPATHDARDLLYATYRTGAPLPGRPAQFGHETLLPANGWGMLGNGPDETVSPGFKGAGDCVFAGGGHETMLWTAEGKGQPVLITGANALADYAAVTGYNQGDQNSDQGTNVRTALQYRQDTGLIDDAGDRHLIGAYLALEPGNTDHLLEALYLFGAVGIGIQVPSSAMDQFNGQQAWDVVVGATNEGGHYIPLVASRGNLVCVTWGRTQEMTLDFYTKYCDEAWAIISPEMMAADKSPDGFDLSALQADFQALQS